MGNRQTKAAKPQTQVTQTAPKFEPATESSTVKTEVPVTIPETPPQPSEPPFEPPPKDTSLTTEPQHPPLEDPPVDDTEIKEQKESEKELLEPLPVLLNESESVEEKLKKSEEVVHVIESVTEENELISVTAPVTDQEVIFEDPIPITTSNTPSQEIKNDKVEIIKETKIEDVSKITTDAVLVDSEIAISKEEVKNEEEDDDEIADSNTPSIAMETASVSSSAIRMDVEYMKGIMGNSLTVPDATSNESMIGSLAVSEQTLDESLWDTTTTGPSKSSLKCPIPTKEDSAVSVDFQNIDQTIQVVLTTLEPVQKDDQKKQEMIPEEVSEHEISEVQEVESSKSVLDPLEEIPVPEKRTSSRNLEKFESFVSVEFREENEEIKVGFNCVSKAQIASSTSMVSDKQMSVELTTPFVDVDDETAVKESKSIDALSVSKSSEKSKTKKPKKSTSGKSTGSGIEGDLGSTNPQPKRSNSGQSKLLKSSPCSSTSGPGRGSRGRGRGRKN